MTGKHRRAFRMRHRFDVTLHPDLLGVPETWKRLKRIFVDSMSDLFHEGVPLESVRQVFATMSRCDRRVHLVLTKRGRRSMELAPELSWAPNVSTGARVEDAQVIDRFRDLARVPAAVRSLSCEPLIGLPGRPPLDGVGWGIVGVECGPKARPMAPGWLESVPLKCETAGAAFFFKRSGGVHRRATGRELHGRTYEDAPPRAGAGPAV